MEKNWQAELIVCISFSWDNEMIHSWLIWNMQTDQLQPTNSSDYHLSWLQNILTNFERIVEAVQIFL